MIGTIGKSDLEGWVFFIIWGGGGPKDIIGLKTYACYHKNKIPTEF